MRVLFIHSDYIEVETKKQAIKDFAEDVSEHLQKADECLIVFMSVEKSDADDKDSLIQSAVENIIEVKNNVNAPAVFLYPYAHLSHELAAPQVAIEILNEVYDGLKCNGVPVEKAPFGWYKSFKLSCKGHPLSELSRTIKPKQKTREEIVEKIQKKFIVLKQDGQELGISEDVIPETLSENMQKFIREELGKGVAGEVPGSIKIMQSHELIDYEPASDSGHFRYYPKGHIIFRCLEEWSRKIALEELGCMEIDTPIMYDWSLPDIRGQAGSFHERHYMIKTPDEKKEFVLRFAGDFGLFRIMKDSTMSYRNLPVRVFEFSKSFRYEKRGELTGLKRLRAFHMPDIHTFSKDLRQGWDEYKILYKKYDDFAASTGIQYVVVFRIEEDFYNEYRDEILELLEYSDKPAFVELLSGRKHYWVVKHEFQGMDASGGFCQLTTVQLDVEDAERYGITYVDSSGEKQGCIITHSSIGSIERWIHTIIENALMMKKPQFPFWLAPVQVRIIPVSEYINEDAKKLLSLISSTGIRADLDDRNLSLGKRIREAEKEWTPHIIVYGDREKNEGILSVRTRNEDINGISIDDYIKHLNELLGNYPQIPLSMPKNLSLRIGFRK